MTQQADTIYTNGKIITATADDSIAEAVAILGDKILAVGSADEIAAFKGKETAVIDLGGKTMVPGFIDAHLHTAVYGGNLLSIDCRSPKVKSIEDIKALVAAAAAGAKPGEWIRGWGYDHSKLAEGRHPNRFDLDEVAPNNPVMLTRVCAHISAHNSASLKAAGIGDKDTPPAGGGEYEYVDGVVSGVVFENAHMAMMKVAAMSKEEIVEAVKVANDALVAEGITSVHDSGGFGAVQMAAFQEAVRQNKMQIRVYAMIFSFVENLQFVDDYLKIGVHSGFGDNRFKLGPIKIMIDGSSSGPTAATRDPYAGNPNSSGIMSMDQATIDDVVARAHAAGWQMTCHAVGDKAIDAMLSAYEKAQAAFPRPNARHRIEHSAMMTEGLMEREKALGIVPIPQPVFLYEFGDGYVKNYGPERAAVMMPCGDYVRAGITCGGSSDCPITFSNPFLNMHVAVNRTTQSGQVVGEEQRISIADALRLFTTGAAYAAFEEDIKGSIEPGKLADLVILSDDLYSTPAEKIKDITAEATIIGGKVVYQR